MVTKQIVHWLRTLRSFIWFKHAIYHSQTAISSDRALAMMHLNTHQHTPHVGLVENVTSRRSKLDQRCTDVRQGCMGPRQPSMHLHRQRSPPPPTDHSNTHGRHRYLLLNQCALSLKSPPPILQHSSLDWLRLCRTVPGQKLYTVTRVFEKTLSRSRTPAWLSRLQSQPHNLGTLLLQPMIAALRSVLVI